MTTKNRIKSPSGSRAPLAKRSKSAAASARTRKPAVQKAAKRVNARSEDEDSVKVARVQLSDGRVIFVPESGGKLPSGDIDRAVERAIAERLAASEA